MKMLRRRATVAEVDLIRVIEKRGLKGFRCLPTRETRLIRYTRSDPKHSARPADQDGAER